MRINLEYFIGTFFIRTPNKLQSIKNFWGGFNEFQGHKLNGGHIWDFL